MTRTADIEGRRRLIERCQTRPIAHVAAEVDISRACASKWVNRWRRHGEARENNLRPRVHQRTRPRCGDQRVEHPLQPPPATQRRRWSAAGLALSGRCHQRPALVHLAPRPRTGLRPVE
ncbi:helix-turn-helix domain-containing protein [Actinoallomurus iriomotensis]|uniref:helix-turn-helix domain-containing protein n=1 Tax=Actinoallomurus iriomotensis TaxID=478107 RepID=UPI00255440A7|nr:leucine zipper domain-containing protein [Actinoallomurus iriomotensis]